ncbi:MAG: hypothetical protein WC139_02060 [Candidatus Kapaibacterium sp.]
MCGIFGILAKSNSEITDRYTKILKHLFVLSESRGKEASGFATIENGSICYHKTPFAATELIKSKEFNNYFNIFTNLKQDSYLTIGHSRLVTNGYEHFNKNNQPVVKKGICAVHNGIIVNPEEIWKEMPNEVKQSDLDTELIPTIIGDYLSHETDMSKILYEFYAQIYGMTTTAMLFDKYDDLLLATNNGSLYYIYDKNKLSFIFASEQYILKKLITDRNLTDFFDLDDIKKLKPRTGLVINVQSLKNRLFDILEGGEKVYLTETSTIRKFNEIISTNDKKIYKNTSFEHNNNNVPKQFIDNYYKRKDRIAIIKRCIKCILPETFPFIEFDNDGVCNFCRNYNKIEYKGKDELAKLAEGHKKENSLHHCLMPFSGGRDSSYALHFAVKELGLRPLAYSYDWGMITDLARRNQSRMCDKLGVEHILISADIRKKRKNIHKNVSAWLKRPSLGTVPLFMAGDKQYFYYANLLMKQNNLKLSILGENLLEITNFKSGFCGIPPKFEKGDTYSLRTKDKIKMLLYYGKEYLLNTAYLNTSMLDTLDAFKSYYVIEHQNINLFSYIKWDEDIITKTLLEEYDWETDPGTNTTWRIGDGTAAFYNYIYYIVAGFTENDTFSSNQIREGDLNREEALQKSIEENKPRWDSIQWYCNTIQVDFKYTIKVVNEIKTLY